MKPDDFCEKKLTDGKSKLPCPRIMFNFVTLSLLPIQYLTSLLFFVCAKLTAKLRTVQPNLEMSFCYVLRSACNGKEDGVSCH